MAGDIRGGPLVDRTFLLDHWGAEFAALETRPDRTVYCRYTSDDPVAIGSYFVKSDSFPLMANMLMEVSDNER